jgi:hypothetical protein
MRARSVRRAAANLAGAAGVLLFLIALPSGAAASAARWTLDGFMALRYQGYRSGAVSETLLAKEAEFGLRAAGGTDLTAGLRLRAGEDLYDQRIGGDLRLDYSPGALDLQLTGQLEQSSPGRLSDPWLFFNPDSVLNQIARSGDYQSGGLSLEAGWTSAFWDARLRAARTDRRYDEPDVILADRVENDLQGELGLSLPAGIRLETELGGTTQRFAQRPASDADQWRTELRAIAPLGSRAQVQVSGNLSGRAVENADSLATYEEPGGGQAEISIGVDRFGDARSYSISLTGGRERWDAYDGYYQDGWSAEAEAYASGRLRGELSADLLVQAARFDPDALAGAEWILRRGHERRLTGDLALRFRAESRWPLTLSLSAEEMRLRAQDEDRFSVLQGGFELHWRPPEPWSGSLRASLDQYISRMEGEATEREWGMSGGIELAWQRGSWRLAANLERQRRFTFLAGAEPVDDWESGLELGWHP